MQSKKMLWTGRIISGLVILFMIVDSVGKVMKFAPYLEGTVRVGYPASLVVPLGIVFDLYGRVCDSDYFGPRCDSADRLSWRRDRDSRTCRPTVLVSGHDGRTAVGSAFPA